MIIWWILGAVMAVVALVLLISYLCYRMAFYSPPRKDRGDALDFPKGEIYEPFWPAMEKWARQTRELPHEDMEIVSFDGLRLRGKYYEYAAGAPIEIMFPGYRGNAERDLSGGVQRCFKLGRSALVVDQRCNGLSEGSVITFGIREHRDCLAWVDFAIRRFGPDVRLILTGISMGASTVLMAGGHELPPNVLGILADCGFNCARDIIRVVIGKMNLPVNISYFFVKLAARLYGGFDLEESSAVELVQRCRVPVIFFHGQDDDFVPCWMSQTNFARCASRKELVLIPKAGHGLSYPVEPQTYLEALRAFFGPEASADEASTQ